MPFSWKGFSVCQHVSKKANIVRSTAITSSSPHLMWSAGEIVKKDAKMCQNVATFCGMDRGMDRSSTLVSSLNILVRNPRYWNAQIASPGHHSVRLAVSNIHAGSVFADIRNVDI